MAVLLRPSLRATIDIDAAIDVDTEGYIYIYNIDIDNSRIPVPNTQYRALWDLCVSRVIYRIDNTRHNTMIMNIDSTG